MTITVTDDYGNDIEVIKDVIDYDYIEKEYVQQIAECYEGHLTEEQIKEVEKQCKNCERYPTNEDLQEIVQDVLGQADEVTIICYNKERKMKRKDAIKEFEDSILMCEGSERDRYCSIVAGLKAGYLKVDDEWKWQDAVFPNK